MNNIQVISKLSGIYQIKNKVNNKIYIGHSINICLRWYFHMNNLIKDNHPNFKIQEDYNKYGLSAFEFSILELLDGKSKLIKREQEYLNKLDFLNNYNINNSTIENMIPDVKKFITYMNSKWLVPKGISDKIELNKYKIYKDEHRQEIINMIVDCKLLKLYPSQITFNKVINLMEKDLGYSIETKRGNINKTKYTYKLIIDFDEEKSKFGG